MTEGFFFPDIGVPGSATSYQKEAVEKLIGKKLEYPLSAEQAQLYLAARDYARSIAIFRNRANQKTGQDQILLLVRKIVSEADLREYVTNWSNRRYKRDSSGPSSRLTKDEFFFRILGAL